MAWYVEDETVKGLVSKELRISQSLLGYRSMWRHIMFKVQAECEQVS